MPGGLGVITGQEWFGIPPQFTTLVGGVGLVLTVVMNPDGIAPPTIEGFERLWNRIRGRRPRPAGRAPDPGGPGPNPVVPAMSSRAEDPV
jgi:branched-chain amino acid transport system permease protein